VMTELQPKEKAPKRAGPARGASQKEPRLQLYVVRHGETEWTLSGRHTGATEVKLTANGEDEARELSSRLKEIPFSRVFTSPRLRARRTCYLAMSGRPAEIEPDLAEWAYGAYEGRRASEIREKLPNWDIVRDGCPHGESPEQVSERADRLLARLAELGGIVALFSHGQFGSVLAARWTLKPVSEAESFSSGPASISVLSFDPNHPNVPVIED
jgi:broad specificity phosphatase PhoE